VQEWDMVFELSRVDPLSCRRIGRLRNSGHRFIICFHQPTSQFQIEALLTVKTPIRTYNSTPYQCRQKFSMTTMPSSEFTPSTLTHSSSARAIGKVCSTRTAQTTPPSCISNSSQRHTGLRKKVSLLADLPQIPRVVSAVIR
jgi:hypothetical protein